jgi:hypothetical protein
LTINRRDLFFTRDIHVSGTEKFEFLIDTGSDGAVSMSEQLFDSLVKKNVIRVSAQQLQVVGVSDPAVHTGARSRGWL